MEEWPINVLGFAAAVAFVCDGSDDALAKILADTPATGDVMASITPFSCVELKENPTILSCLVESGFYRGPVLKPRPSFAKVPLPLLIDAPALRLTPALEGLPCCVSAGCCQPRHRKKASCGEGSRGGSVVYRRLRPRDSFTGARHCEGLTTLNTNTAYSI